MTEPQITKEDLDAAVDYIREVTPLEPDRIRTALNSEEMSCDTRNWLYEAQIAAPAFQEGILYERRYQLQVQAEYILRLQSAQDEIKRLEAQLSLVERHGRV